VDNTHPNKNSTTQKQQQKNQNQNKKTKKEKKQRKKENKKQLACIMHNFFSLFCMEMRQRQTICQFTSFFGHQLQHMLNTITSKKKKRNIRYTINFVFVWKGLIFLFSFMSKIKFKPSAQHKRCI